MRLLQRTIFRYLQQLCKKTFLGHFFLKLLDKFLARLYHFMASHKKDCISANLAYNYLAKSNCLCLKDRTQMEIPSSYGWNPKLGVCKYYCVVPFFLLGCILSTYLVGGWPEYIYHHVKHLVSKMWEERIIYVTCLTSHFNGFIWFAQCFLEY